ncbi:hypothetical protein H1C71_019674 [Ictidomys tridecemlineatus]|nr:hypothetical protein H1C71_019674 [Ictidomys tridecemlineatus]
MTSSLPFQLPPLPPRLGRGEGGGGPRRRGRDREERQSGGGTGLVGPPGTEPQRGARGRRSKAPGSRDFGEHWVDLIDIGGGVGAVKSGGVLWSSQCRGRRVGTDGRGSGEGPGGAGLFVFRSKPWHLGDGLDVGLELARVKRTGLTRMLGPQTLAALVGMSGFAVCRRIKACRD